jgi:uncharacterized protein (DUF1697 family)
MRYVALLRGLNVGGHRVMTMADLRAQFERAGATQVATYIQSGNVVFAHASRAPQSLLAAATKLDVVVRTARQMTALVERDPFAAEPPEHRHLLFLPSATKITVTALAPERYVQRGADVYVCLPTGVGRSKLAAALGKTGGTMRNWRTVTTLTEWVTSQGQA